MRSIEKLRMKLQMLLHRGRESRMLDAELTFHLEQQIAENIASGMGPDEARYAALRSFGNPALLREQTRGKWGSSWLDILLRDLRIGLRTLSRTPGFALTAVLVMALGIGANVALFTVVRSVLLRPLPFHDPDRLVVIYGENKIGDPNTGNIVAAGDFYDWQKAAHGFERMAIWRWTGYNMSGNAGQLPEFVNAGTCSWNLFSTLGVTPRLGRLFSASDDQTGAAPTTLLTWSFFHRRFHSDASLLGHTIRLNGKTYTVVGVLPKWFTWPDPEIQLWVPYHIDVNAEDLRTHYSHTSFVVARLKPGVTATAATAQVSAVEHQLYMRLHGDGPVAQAAISMPMIQDVVGDAKTPLYTLMAAVACLLLIACINLSNLLVARGAARRRESAIRAALGSRRMGLIRQQLVESLLICVGGGALGLLLAAGATRWLVLHWVDMPRAEAVRPDGLVMAFALGVILLTGIFAGVLPALSGANADVLMALQEGSRGAGAGPSRARLRKTLLTAEIALTVVLLIGAGLLFRSFLRLRSDDLGCATKNVLTMNYFLRGNKYSTPAQIVSFDTQLLEKVRHLPGVLAAGLTNAVPGGGYYGDMEVHVTERPPLPPGVHQFALFRTADPGYFSAMEIPLIRGRFFSDDERLDHDKFVIINQEFVRLFFPNENPIGKHLHENWRSAAGEDYQIVGVVGDTLWQIGKPVRAMMWFPILGGSPGSSSDNALVVRTNGDPEALSLSIQKTIADLDPELPVKQILTMRQIVGEATANASFSATLLLVFAGLSLLLAAVGLYGVLAYLVTQRTREIGVRMALGAERESVLRLVLIDGIKPALLGLLLGLLVSAATTRLIASVLYGTSPLDGTVIASVIATLLAVTVLACLLPAWRASRLDPMTALRME